MSYYLKLQWKIISRYISDYGLPVIMSLIILPVVFFWVSEYVFDNSEYAKFIIFILALIILSRLGGTKKMNFMNTIYRRDSVLKIRFLENAIAAVPFIVVLVYHNNIYLAIALFISSLTFSLLNFSLNFNLTIPTPFKSDAFEFNIGFRKYYLVFVSAYYLVYISVQYENLNIGLFAQLLIILVCSTFYSYPEKNYYIWIYSLSSKDFIREKAETGVKLCFFSCLPITIILSVFFMDDIELILGIQFFYLIYIILVIFGKYAAYPLRINLPQALGIILCVWLPPVILLIMPYFYKKAITNLNRYLKC